MIVRDDLHRISTYKNANDKYCVAGPDEKEYMLHVQTLPKMEFELTALTASPSALEELGKGMLPTEP